MIFGGVPPSAPGISAPGISAPIGAEVPVAEIPGAEGRTHYLWSISPKNISQLKKGWGWRRKINHSKIITNAGAEIIGVS